jgi:glyoxylase I family protein
MANSSQELAAHLFHLEQQLLQPSTRCDEVALRSLLAEDFREFGSSGRIYTRQQGHQRIRRGISTEDHPQRSTLQSTAADIALLTYRSTRTTALKVASHALRSSLWVYRDGRWQMIFHQGTPI